MSVSRCCSHQWLSGWGPAGRVGAGLEVGLGWAALPSGPARTASRPPGTRGLGETSSRWRHSARPLELEPQGQRTPTSASCCRSQQAMWVTLERREVGHAGGGGWEGAAELWGRGQIGRKAKNWDKGWGFLQTPRAR